MLTALERRVLAAIDSVGLVRDLTELIGMVSVGGTAGEIAIQHRMAERLTDDGLRVDHWPLDLPALRSHPDYCGEEVERGEAWGTVAANGSGEPGLILQGHVDVVPGRATHGSTAYAGVSAIDAYLPLHAALASLQHRRNIDPEPLMQEYPVAYPLSVGRLTAGDWASSVPDWLVAEGRYGLRIDEDPSTARAELEATVAQAADTVPYLRDHPPTVTWSGGAFRGGRLPPGHRLGDVVETAHTDAGGGPVQRRAVPYGSDLRLYAAAGIPTLHYGPGQVMFAHGPDEQVPIDQLVATAQVLALTVLRCCDPVD